MKRSTSRTAPRSAKGKARGTARARRRATAKTPGIVARADANPLAGAIPSGNANAVYRGAAVSRRTAFINAPDIGPVAALASNGPMLLRRSRAAQKQNAWANNARKTYVANAVGDGITPKFKHDPDGWGKAARALFDQWVPFSDPSGTLHFYGQQAQGFGELFEAGEFFVQRLYQSPEADLPVPLQIRILQSEHCPLWYTRELGGGRWVRSGVQTAPDGYTIEGYWMYPGHPGEWSRSRDATVLRFYPADQIRHVFLPESAESMRGCPHLARSLLRLFGLDEYDDAELDKQRMAAMITAVIEMLDPEKAGARLGIVQTLSSVLAARGGGPITEIEPGTVTVAGPGESVKPFPPAETSANYLPFHDVNFRAIAADCGLTFEMLTGDLSKTSYVSLRFGSLEFRRRCRLLQGVFNFQFNRTIVAQWWLDAALLNGRLDAPAGYEQPDGKIRRDCQQILWVPPAWDRIQPDKEIPAEIEACQAGFTTTDRVVAERTGEDGATIAEEIALINARNDKLKIALTSDGRFGTKSGAFKDEPPQTLDENGDPIESKDDGLVDEDDGDAKADKSNVKKKKTGTTNA